MVRFENVSKQFGKTKVLDHVSFHIEKGEFVFLVGPSGAGKTTILRLLFRDLAPTSGKIFLDALDTASLPKGDIPRLRRSIGIVFQDFKVLSDHTVFENVAVTLDILGKSDREIAKKVPEILELVGLKDRQRAFPAQLSAGELQRVAIARAVVGGPKLLIADEPTGNLDPATSWEIMQILKEINQLGTTIIMATHNRDVVDTMKKRVITLKDGKIAKDQKEGKYQ